VGSANLDAFRTADPNPEINMQAKDIKRRTWYSRKERMDQGSPVLVLGTDRYSESGFREDRVMYASPGADMTSGRTSRGYRRDGRVTGYLAIRLSGLAERVVNSFAARGENEDDAQKIMTEAAELLTRTVADLTARGKVPVSEINRKEYDQRGFRVVLVQGRDLDGDYMELTSTRYEQAQEAKRAREAMEKAAQARRQNMIKVITEAREMGLNTDPSRGGAQPDRGSWGTSDSQIRMSLETYAGMVAEIARLRRVVASTLKADEIGEGEPCG
jgi:hypothetical protein